MHRGASVIVSTTSCEIFTKRFLNRVSVITVAESHPVTSQKKTISKIDYQVDKHTNRLENKVTGKGKRVGNRKFKLNVS